MDVLKTFIFDDTEYDVNIQVLDDKQVFKADQIGKIIGIRNIRSSIQHFDADEKVVHQIDTPGGAQECTFLTEMGVYRLLNRSDKPKARPFQKWVAHVIQTIRETGKYEASKQLDELKAKHECEKVNLLAEYKSMSEVEIHTSLIGGYDHKKLVYIGKIADLEDGESLIKIGSTANIRQRVGKLRSDYGSFHVTKVFECREHDRFEKFLHQHVDIKRYRRPIYNDRVSFETYAMNDEQLKRAVGIASNNIVQYRKDTEQTTDVREIVRQEVRAEVAKAVGEKRKHRDDDVQQESNRGHCTVMGKKIQIYSQDGNLVKTFQRLIDTLREWKFDEKIYRAGVLQACQGDYVYAGYRWMTLERELDDTTVQRLRPVAERKRIHQGWVALLNQDETRIVKVYSSYKKASEATGFVSGGALQKRKNKGDDIHGYAIRAWSECSDVLQKTCKEDGIDLPGETKRGRHIAVLKLDPVTSEVVHEYQTMNEAFVKIGCAARTLKSAIVKGTSLRGYKWKYAG